MIDKIERSNRLSKAAEASRERQMEDCLAAACRFEQDAASEKHYPIRREVALRLAKAWFQRALNLAN